MNRYLPLLLTILASSAQAQLPLPFAMPGTVGPTYATPYAAAYANPFGNPFAPPLANPFGNPYAQPFGGGGFPGQAAMLSNPFAPASPNPLAMLGLQSGLANPLGALANPLGGLGALNTLGALGSLGPALQLAPNLVSAGHMQQLTNPYMGGPFAGNPYLRQTIPLPFAAPAFSPGMPSWPTMPAAQPAASGAFPLFQAPTRPVQAAPATQPMSSLLPPPGFLPMPQMGEPRQPPPQALRDFKPYQPGPVATPEPAARPAPVADSVASQPMPPIDPATFLQMFMKPAEPAK